MRCRADADGLEKARSRNQPRRNERQGQMAIVNDWEKAVIEQGGGRYRGIQDEYLYFDDPRTDSTLMIHQHELKVAADPVAWIEQKIATSRAHFKALARKE